MSDFFPGPGWWMASDGKWYDPSTHPDPNYRETFAEPDVPLAASTDVDEDEVEDVLLDLSARESADVAVSAAVVDVPTAAESAKTPTPERKAVPGRVSERESVPASPAGSSGWVDDSLVEDPQPGFTSENTDEQVSAQDRAEAVRMREMEERKARLERARRSAEALRDSAVPATVPTEVADEGDEAGADVVGTTSDAPAAEVTQPSVAGRTQLEIDGATPAEDQTSALNYTETPTRAPVSEATTTALVHVPAVDDRSVDPIDKLLAVLLFLCGLAMIVGAFMPWTTGATTEIGWDRPDGVVVVLAGVVAAACAGPLYGGLLVAWARGAAITAGVVGVMGVGVVTVTTLTEMELTGRTIAAGVYVVGAATLGAIVASLASSKTS